MKRLLRALAALLALWLAVLPAALGEYWTGDREVRCRDHLPACRLLQTVMLGSFDGFDPSDRVSGRVLSSALDQLSALTEDDLSHFTAEFGEDAARVRLCVWLALANCLWADILAEAPAGAMSPARQVLLLFLDPESQPDGMAQLAQIRAAMTGAVEERIAGGENLPAAFVRWLVEEDDWLAHRGVEAGDGED